ncbi:helix-turn-helix transcriptional regulator [Actinomadura miaoliensis]
MSNQPAPEHIQAGRLIRDRRNDLGLTQAQVAAEGGPSVKLLSQLENGHRWDSLSARSLTRLEKVLQLPKNTLTTQLSAAAYPEWIGEDLGLRRIWDITELPEHEREIAIRSLITYRQAMTDQGMPKSQDRSA